MKTLTTGILLAALVFTGLAYADSVSVLNSTTGKGYRVRVCTPPTGSSDCLTVGTFTTTTAAPTTTTAAPTTTTETPTTTTEAPTTTTAP